MADKHQHVIEENIHIEANDIILDINSEALEEEEYHHRIYMYDYILETTNFIKKQITFTPKVAIICGSGLDGFLLSSIGKMLKNSVEIPYKVIPHFPRNTMEGQMGSLVFGYLEGIPTMCMKGRFHYYEGFPLWKCCMPVRVMKLLGVTHVIITNAAGGLRPDFEVGDVMLVKDHINLMGFSGNNPLKGPNDERFGPRFPPMTKAYDRDIIGLAKQVANDIKMSGTIHEGVYTCLGGPNFETVAELRMLKNLGADAIGMSTAHEVITARHCDMSIFVLCLITNKCVVEYEHHSEPNHEDLIGEGKQREEELKKFIIELLIRVFKK